MFEPLPLLVEFIVPDFLESIELECDFVQWVPECVLDLPETIVELEPQEPSPSRPGS